MAHASLYLKGFDAVEYACASSKDRCNYALSPSCADRMQLFRVLRFIVEEHPATTEDDIEITPLEIGEIREGASEIRWVSYSADMAETDFQLWDFEDPLARHALESPNENK